MLSIFEYIARGVKRILLFFESIFARGNVRRGNAGTFSSYTLDFSAFRAATYEPTIADSFCGAGTAYLAA